MRSFKKRNEKIIQKKKLIIKFKFKDNLKRTRMLKNSWKRFKNWINCLKNLII